jgi:hypothetical protein
LPVVLCGCETRSQTLREEKHWLGCLRTGCWGEYSYLDRRGMEWQEVGE